MTTQSQKPTINPDVLHGNMLLECPACHGHQLVELHSETPLRDSTMLAGLQRELQLWLASRCPEHLGTILKWSKN